MQTENPQIKNKNRLGKVKDVVEEFEKRIFDEFQKRTDHAENNFTVSADSMKQAFHDHATHMDAIVKGQEQITITNLLIQRQIHDIARGELRTKTIEVEGKKLLVSDLDYYGRQMELFGGLSGNMSGFSLGIEEKDEPQEEIKEEAKQEDSKEEPTKEENS